MLKALGVKVAGQCWRTMSKVMQCLQHICGCATCTLSWEWTNINPLQGFIITTCIAMAHQVPHSMSLLSLKRDHSSILILAGHGLQEKQPILDACLAQYELPFFIHSERYLRGVNTCYNTSVMQATAVSGILVARAIWYVQRRYLLTHGHTLKHWVTLYRNPWFQKSEHIYEHG